MAFHSQAFYWSKVTGGDWFYKTRDEWEAETGMGRYEQETARKRLRRIKVLEEKRQGTPAKSYYRVDFDVLFKLIAGLETADGFLPSRRGESTQQDGGNPPISSIGTETTTENVLCGGKKLTPPEKKLNPAEKKLKADAIEKAKETRKLTDQAMEVYAEYPRKSNRGEAVKSIIKAIGKGAKLPLEFGPS